MPAFTGEPRLVAIADGVHAFLQPDGGWCLNNAGLLAGAGGPVLVDTAATEARAGRLRELVLKEAGEPPSVVLNTHSHGDHTFGNFVFPEAVVIGHEGARREAQGAGLHLTGLWPDVPWGGIRLVPPQLTFAGPATLWIGDYAVELHSFGPAHSGSDTVAWLPRQRVLFTGDLVMSGVTPFLLTGSVSGLRAAIDRLRGFDPEIVVPGHGPVGGPELLDATDRYLDWLTAVAHAGRDAGLSPLEAAREADPGEFAALLDGERLAANLHRMYAELGSDVDSSPDRLFAAVVKLNGGLPACHA
jgi:cyclase